MAPAKFERIVSVSSEDPAHPAENLLKNAFSDKKWKSKEHGEKQISVVIQLEKAEKITGIDVGNYGSAFVEILVSKSSNPDEFKVLVLASSLMTLQEAKLGSNLTNVRFFKEDNLVKEVSSEKWDRLKIICSQPYNKHIQYGLTFIVVHALSTSVTETTSSSLGKFQLKKNDVSNSLAIGSLFAKRKENESVELKGAAAIRAASSSGIIDKKILHTPGSSNETDSSQSDLRKKTPKTTNREKTPKNNFRDSPNGNTNTLTTTGNEQNKRRADDTKGNARKKVPTKPRLEKPFNKLFEGVVFTISGFQNPYRSEIRSKALAMGAKYKPDWDNTCTHLLCAFPNTPKFNQVLGVGKIITKEWIETCYNRRMRLPWRRYALHPPDKAEPLSEEEIFEKVERPPSPVDNRRRVSPSRSSGEDTEEEIERVLRIQAKNNEDTSTVDTESNSVNGRASQVECRTPVKASSSKKNKESPILNIKVKEERTVKNKDSLKLDNHNKDLEDKQVGSSNEEDTSGNINNKTPKKKRKTTKKNSLAIKKELDISEVNKPIISNIIQAPEDTYDLETEEEDDSCDSKKWNLPPLPTFFEGFKFFVANDLSDELQKEIRRYIFAHKGCLIEECDILFEEVQFVITESKEEVRKVKENCPNVIGVRPDWVWKAHDEARIPPTKTYEVNS